MCNKTEEIEGAFQNSYSGLFSLQWMNVVWGIYDYQDIMQKIIEAGTWDIE